MKKTHRYCRYWNRSKFKHEPGKAPHKHEIDIVGPRTQKAAQSKIAVARPWLPVLVTCGSQACLTCHGRSALVGVPSVGPAEFR